jgi:hypothetical protein
MAIAHQLIWLLVSESKSGDEDEAHGPVASARAPGATAVADDAASGAGIVSRLDLRSPDEKKQGVSSRGPALGHGFQKQLKGRDTLPAKTVTLMRRIIDTFPPTARALLELQARPTQHPNAVVHLQSYSPHSPFSSAYLCCFCQ